MTADERTRRLIAGLRTAGVRQAAFFVAVGNLEKNHGAGGRERLAAYAEAGHVLANHSWSHERLSTSEPGAYLADIDRADRWLRGHRGYRAWFRFPFLDEGGSDKVKRDAIRAGLAARGLRNGYVTVDASDWHLEQLTIAAARDGESMNMSALRTLYVESHVEAAEFYDKLARQTLGRSPAHVLLLHETDLAALYVPDLVAALRARGWEIITADQAYRDPLKSAHPEVRVAQGTLTEALAWERGLPPPRWYVRNNTELAKRLFAERVLGTPQPSPAQAIDAAPR
jgi:peptidoglycan/xylan/chitin deacetylase (PgdA/CDA1 family)